MLVGMPSQVKYGIFNDKGEQIYYGFEGKQKIFSEKKNIPYLESDICQRMYCPKTRQFDFHIVDSANEVYLKRIFAIRFYSIILLGNNSS